MKNDSLKKILPFLIVAIIAATLIFLPGGVKNFIDNFLFSMSNFLNLGIFTNEASQILLVRGLLLIVTYFIFKFVLKRIEHFKKEKQSEQKFIEYFKYADIHSIEKEIDMWNGSYKHLWMDYYNEKRINLGIREDKLNEQEQIFEENNINLTLRERNFKLKEIEVEAKEKELKIMAKKFNADNLK